MLVFLEAPYLVQFMYVIWTAGKEVVYCRIVSSKYNLISCDKITFAKAVQAEGIGLGEHYGCVISSWDWLHQILGFTQSTPNAEYTRDNSFNLYVNEKYGDAEINEIVEAIVKVEDHYLK